jgi:hypothetical protein
MSADAEDTEGRIPRQMKNSNPEKHQFSSNRCNNQIDARVLITIRAALE